MTKSIAEFYPLEPKLKPSAPKAASTVAAFVRKAGGVSEDLGHLMQSLLVGIEADRPVLAPASGLCRHNPRLLARHEVSMREVKERLVAILAARLPEEDPVVLRLLALEPVRLAIDRWLADLEPSPTEAVAAIWPRLPGLADCLACRRAFPDSYGRETGTAGACRRTERAAASG